MSSSSWFNFSPRSVDNYLGRENDRLSISSKYNTRKSSADSDLCPDVFYSPIKFEDSASAARNRNREEHGFGGNSRLRSLTSQQLTTTSSCNPSSTFEVRTCWTSRSASPSLCGFSPGILCSRCLAKFQPTTGSRRFFNDSSDSSSLFSLEIGVKMPSTFRGTVSISTDEKPSSLGQHVLPPSAPVSATAVASGSGPPSHHRRGSFLYRATADGSSSSAGVEGSPSPKQRNSVQSSAGGWSHSDDVIVTPFAQILRTLRRVRNNFMIISNLPSTCSRLRRLTPDRDDVSGSTCPSRRTLLAEDERRHLAIIALDDLEWSLEQLENIQIHQSVSDLASNKFRRLLSRELNHFAETTKSGSEVSDYICNTFLDNQKDIELPISRLEEGASAVQRVATPVEDHCKQISTISGVRTSDPEVTSLLDPEIMKYGIKVNNESEMDEVMGGINSWGVDIFRIKELSDNRPLTCLTFTILKERHLLTEFSIPEVTLVNYLTQLERHYKSDVTYHNSVHAADVMQSSHYLISVPALQNVFTQLEVLAVLFGAAIHDVDHPGLTNQYLINSSAELAIMYNDASVLENHHLALAFKLLQSDGCDIFCNLSTKTRQTLRRMVIDIVLATDMSKHMSLLADLKTMVETKTLTGCDVIQLNDYNDRMMVLQNLVHCSDLSNPTKPLRLYCQWTDRIMEEFFRQGDLEKELGLDVSPMCDRLTATVEKSQIGFIDYIVHPLWETWADLVFPDCQRILDALEENRQWYQSQITPHPDQDQTPEAENKALHPDTIPEVKAETEIVTFPIIELQQVCSEVFVEETLPLTLQSPATSGDA